MKNITLTFLIVCVIGSCKNRQNGEDLIKLVRAAQMQKTEAENRLADFKSETSGIFKNYDSLKSNGRLDSALKAKHDSLFRVGISLDMRIVHCQMTIDLANALQMQYWSGLLLFGHTQSICQRARM
jgi:hypothetical protein